MKMQQVSDHCYAVANPAVVQRRAGCLEAGLLSRNFLKPK
jgi:hypothetical protein